MDFIEHLKQSVIKGKLVVGVSNLQDWLSLLSLDDITGLVFILEGLKDDKSENVEYVATLVYLLCKLEDFDFTKSYGGDTGLLLAQFLCMANLELLCRQGYIRLLKGLSFSDQSDFKVELIKPPTSLPFLPNLNLSKN